MSLIIDYIRIYLFKVRGSQMKELNVIMDNYVGQNKNYILSPMAPYMMKSGLFEKFNLIFPLKGHTKNMCDHMFNLMKKKYSKKKHTRRRKHFDLS